MIPIEVSVCIFGYLSPEDFLQVRLVCKSWNNIALLCTKNWRSCCEAAGLAVHSQSLVSSIGSGRSWKDIYFTCKDKIKELNVYQEIRVINARFDSFDKTREMKFIPPDKLLSNKLNNLIECWRVECFGPSFKFKAIKTWTLRKEYTERLIDVNNTFTYMLSLLQPDQVTLRLVSTATGDIVSTHTGNLPTCYEPEPLLFVSFRRGYCIRKCQNCDCFTMCSYYLDVTSHSTFLYMVYLYNGKIYTVCHPLKVPDRTELKQLDSHLIDKLDLISYSENQVKGLCEQHILLVQSYYAIAKYIIKFDGAPELCGSVIFMPVVAEVILLEMELHGTTGTAFEGPIPGYCLSHCSRYWAVCDEVNRLFIYDLSTMTLKKTINTEISKRFILHPVQFSMLYALMYCSSHSHSSHVSYLLIYIGPGPTCGKIVRKVSIKAHGIIPLKATFVQLEMAKFYQSPKEQTALTFYPNDFLVFHLPGWCM